MPGAGKKHSAVKLLLSFLFSIFASTASCAEETYPAEVIAVLDGDTVLVSRANQQPFKVRMADIDAPEREQEYGPASQQSLAELVLRKQVQVTPKAVDSYGRIVAVITANGRNINQELVMRGMAWALPRARDKRMFTLQTQARQAKRGLWVQSNPLRPGAWRAVHMHQTRPRAKSYTCGSKQYCRQMDSCEEAKFYLTKCSVKTLDGDQNGVPCESLCLVEENMVQ